MSDSPERTLCYVISGNKVLLGMKKSESGFGNSRYNGFGGGVEDGETVEEAAIRELFEETNLVAKTEHLDKRGEIKFYFPAKPKWNQTVHVYFLEQWEGEPAETTEIMKPEWFDINAIPYDKMWDSDSRWLPIILSGKKIKATFVWGEDNKTVDNYEINEI